MDIVDKIRELAGFACDIPLPDPDNEWVRFFCPFCQPLQRKRHGRKPKFTAAVNHSAQWFECYRCDRAFGVDDTSYPKSDTELILLLRDHDALIKRVLGKVSAKFGKWINASELRDEAHELVWGYVYRPLGGKNDAGMWSTWQADANGDSARFDSLFGAALRGDLMNYAESRVNWDRKQCLTQVPGDVNVKARVANPVNDFGRGDSELDRLTGYQSDVGRHAPGGVVDSEGRFGGDAGNSVGSLRSQSADWLERIRAESDKTRFDSWGKSIVRCTVMRNGLGPVEGHCAYCDRAVAPKVLPVFRGIPGGMQWCWWHSEPENSNGEDMFPVFAREDQNEPDQRI